MEINSMGLLEFVDYAQKTMCELYESLNKVSKETFEQKFCEGHKCPEQNNEGGKNEQI
ncbi:MAG: hypothetical protein IJ681_00370 [Bacteroidales bacterium]|nr:hypothetical protein [Bacteroidales bacterium]